MMESPMKRAVIVGIFVMLGTSFLIAGILLVGNIRETFTTKFELISLFDDVGGLKKGDNIWFSGVKIGTVNNLEFYGKSQVEVTIAIDVKSQKYIFKNAKVKLSSDGLIGNKILVIYGGTDDSGIVTDGDTLIVEKTLGTEEILATLQENNQNILAITTDIKELTHKIVAGDGSVGKLINDDFIYADIVSSVSSIKTTANDAQKMMKTLSEITSSLNKEGSIVNGLTTDTVMFQSIKSSVVELQRITNTANKLIADLQAASVDTSASLGIILKDKNTGSSLKETIKNLENSSQKLDEDLKAIQDNFLLRRYFKKKEKESEKEADPK